MSDRCDLTRRDLLVTAAFLPLATLAASAQTGPLALTSEGDLILEAVDADTAEGLPQGRPLFDRARRLMLEGSFGDPYYGGNGAFAGWDFILDPGPRPAVDAEMQRMDAAPDSYHHSAWGAQYK